jgi:hypothetical protein
MVLIPKGRGVSHGEGAPSTKNKRLQQGKLELKKYDPKVRQHVIFKEQKMPPHSK